MQFLLNENSENCVKVSSVAWQPAALETGETPLLDLFFIFVCFLHWWDFCFRQWIYLTVVVNIQMQINAEIQKNLQLPTCSSFETGGTFQSGLFAIWYENQAFKGRHTGCVQVLGDVESSSLDLVLRSHIVPQVNSIILIVNDIIIIADITEIC